MMRFTHWITILTLGATLAAADFTVAPTLVPNPNPEVPLAALVRFSTSGPVSTRLTISEDSRSWNVDFGPTADTAKGPSPDRVLPRASGTKSA